MGFILLWSILGFPFLALVTDRLNLPTSQISVAMRALAVGAAFLLIIVAKRPPQKVILILFLFFWSVYFYRLMLATFLDLEDLSLPDSTYWIWALGVCFLPALAVLINSDDSFFDRLFHRLLVIGVAAMCLAISSGNTLVENSLGQIYDSNRLNISSLNPISMGHLGATALLMSICVLFSEKAAKREQCVAILIVALGVTTLILANSRGPQVATAGGIALLFLAGAHRKRTLLIGLVLAAITIFLAAYEYEFLFSEAGILRRFVALSQGGDASSYARVVSYQGGWSQFLQSPFWGHSIEEKITQFYPHNVILEALMATGILGGIPFILLIGCAVVRIWKLIRHASPHLWIAVIAFQYILGGMLSGAIYASGTMWVLMGLVLSPSLRTGLVERSRHQPETL